jgi:hypothetical protein
MALTVSRAIAARRRSGSGAVDEDAGVGDALAQA